MKDRRSRTGRRGRHSDAGTVAELVCDDCDCTVRCVVTQEEESLTDRRTRREGASACLRRCRW